MQEGEGMAEKQDYVGKDINELNSSEYVKRNSESSSVTTKEEEGGAEIKDDAKPNFMSRRRRSVSAHVKRIRKANNLNEEESPGNFRRNSENTNRITKAGEEGIEMKDDVERTPSNNEMESPGNLGSNSGERNRIVKERGKRIDMKDDTEITANNLNEMETPGNSEINSENRNRIVKKELEKGIEKKDGTGITANNINEMESPRNLGSNSESHSLTAKEGEEAEMKDDVAPNFLSRRRSSVSDHVNSIRKANKIINEVESAGNSQRNLERPSLTSKEREEGTEMKDDAESRILKSRKSSTEAHINRNRKQNKNINEVESPENSQRKLERPSLTTKKIEEGTEMKDDAESRILKSRKCSIDAHINRIRKQNKNVNEVESPRNSQRNSESTSHTKKREDGAEMKDDAGSRILKSRKSSVDAHINGIRKKNKNINEVEYSGNLKPTRAKKTAKERKIEQSDKEMNDEKDIAKLKLRQIENTPASKVEERPEYVDDSKQTFYDLENLMNYEKVLPSKDILVLNLLRELEDPEMGKQTAKKSPVFILKKPLDSSITRHAEAVEEAAEFTNDARTGPKSETQAEPLDVEMNAFEPDKLQIIINLKSLSSEDAAILIWLDELPKSILKPDSIPFKDTETFKPPYSPQKRFYDEHLEHLASPNSDVPLVLSLEHLPRDSKAELIEELSKSIYYP